MKVLVWYINPYDIENTVKYPYATSIKNYKIFIIGNNGIKWRWYHYNIGWNPKGGIFEVPQCVQWHEVV